MKRSDCHICGRAPEAPYVRRGADRSIVEGCIGGIHKVAADHQQGFGYGVWWNRKEAVSLRIAERRGRLGR
jgi:hypothetical protein